MVIGHLEHVFEVQELSVKRDGLNLNWNKSKEGGFGGPGGI
jgi:hypothetical protein